MQRDTERLTYNIEDAGRLLGIGRNQAYDAAKRGDELILLADRFAKHVDLDMAGLLGKRMRADDVALAGVQGAKQCGRKTAR